MTGMSAGLTFWYVGGTGIFFGRRGPAFAIIACTSCAAPSMLLLRLNWIVICVFPNALTEFMESTPAMVENWRSRGVATAEAIVSGLAPGRLAVTSIVGKSTFGKSLTGRRRYPMYPNRRIANMTRAVMIGRRIKISAIFIKIQAIGYRL